MVFLPSPALRKICQLVQRMCRHPDLPKSPRTSPCRTRDLPDPARFMDTSVNPHTSSRPTRKRTHAPGGPGQ
jgi:hypothetical protein